MRVLDSRPLSAKDGWRSRGASEANPFPTPPYPTHSTLISWCKGLHLRPVQSGYLAALFLEGPASLKPPRSRTCSSRNPSPLSRGLPL